MKKISLLILIVLTGFFFIVPIHNIQASNPPITVEVTNQFDNWSVTHSGGIFYMTSNRVMSEANHLSIEIETYFMLYAEDLYDFILLQNGSIKSRVDIYESLISTVPLQTAYFALEFDTMVIYLNDLSPGNYYQITLVFNPDLGAQNRSDVRDAFNGIHQGTVIWSVVALYDPEDPPTLIVTEPPTNQGGLWHVVEDNRAYIHMRYNHLNSNSDSEPVFITQQTATYHYFDDPDGNGLGTEFREHFTYLSGRWLDDNLSPYFPNTGNLTEQTIYNPFRNVETTFTLEIMYATDISQHMQQGQSLVRSIYLDEIDKITMRVQLHFWNSSAFYYLAIYADDVIIYESSLLSDAFGDEKVPRVSMYWAVPQVAEPINPNEDLNAFNTLPITTGSPQNPMYDWGLVKDWTFNAATSTLSFSVDYKNNITPVLPFIIAAESVDFIQKAKVVLYFTDPDTNDRILYINFHEDDSTLLLKNTSFENVTLWQGEGLWNLTKNEVHVTNAITVYNYIPEITSNGVVYSYFYMPDVPYDDLISVTTTLSYRYWNRSLFGLGSLSPGPVESIVVTSTRGETSTVNPVWVQTVYRSAFIGASLIGLVTAVGWVPVYGWSVAAGALLVGGLFLMADQYEWFARDINQVQQVIPDAATTSAVNAYIMEQSGEASFNPLTDKMYRLHLATLQGGDEVQVMKEYSNTTQVVWETDGTVYVAGADYIKDGGYFFGPGTEEPDDIESRLPAWLKPAVLPIILLFYVVALFQADGFKKPIRLLVISALFAFIYYILIGLF